MAESYTGQIQNGVVVLEGDMPPLAEGTRVRVEPIEPAQTIDEADPIAATRAWLLALAEEAEQDPTPLPADMAEHHDFYAHGRPRS